MKQYLLTLLCMGSILTSCNDEKVTIQEPEKDIMMIGEKVLINSFIGNGPQWGGYEMVSGWFNGQTSLSEEDWNKLYERVEFMRPGLIRMMGSPSWNYLRGDKFDPTVSEPIFFKMMDFCQQNNITVQFGEWGHLGSENEVDESWISNAVDYLDYMINTKGYSCIKYYTIVNEPNGDWASVKGNYNLWKSIIQKFYVKMEEKGLNDKVSIMGPDAAVWSIHETGWMSNTKRDLSDEVQAYDIHTYPDEKTVSSTAFYNLLAAFRAASDKTKPMVLGELGFKYIAGSPLDKENKSAISSDAYSADDSQMMVYKSFYGIDMADATIQSMRAGFDGMVYWGMDDAMYNDTASPSSKKLKRWGFWNILGEELCGNIDDENIRPWFYPVSLLCRYFPSGAKILDVSLPLPIRNGLRACAAEKDGKFTIAIVNAGLNDCEFTLKMEQGKTLEGLKEYYYKSLSDMDGNRYADGKQYEGRRDNRGLPVPISENLALDLEKGVKVNMPYKSFRIYTNME